MRVEESITIGELSRRTGVNIETIRYFERVGVLATPPRTSGGRRVYGTGHVRALGFVRRARELGFSPAEVRATLGIRDRIIAADPLAGWFGATPWEPWPADTAVARFLGVMRRLGG